LINASRKAFPAKRVRARAYARGAAKIMRRKVLTAASFKERKRGCQSISYL